MPINLNRHSIDNALLLIEPGLAQYLNIQAMVVDQVDFVDPKFRRAFNHFYRVRRRNDWQNHYYGLFHKIRYGELTFRGALEQLYKLTGRIEASFISKAFATFNPDLPVIDSRVLNRIGAHLPGAWRQDRIGEAAALYEGMSLQYQTYLTTEDGQYLINGFDIRYPQANISNIKKLDLVLWKAVV